MMRNEILLILSFVVTYGSAVGFYRFFGKKGLFVFNAVATLLANIEVMLVVNAFGMDMTLGNVLFASTFLVTDVLSENHGRKTANQAVLLGTLVSLFFIVTSQMWLLYLPGDGDWASGAFSTLFSNTPRIVCASFAVYFITQLGDVWLYHKWWDWSRKKFGDGRKGLWLRNNGSTMVSQLLNTLLYTFLAFYGTYPMETLVSIFLSSYLIYFVLSIIDTPVVYFCRSIYERRHPDL